MAQRPKSPVIREHRQMASTSPSRCEGGIAALVRDRRLIGENAVFSVYLDKLVYADGSQVSDYLSVVPRTRTTDGLSGVAVLPEVDGKLCLLRVDRHPLGTSGWEVPRGFIDSGESPLDAALRELQEETELRCDITGLVPLAILAPEPGLLAARVQLFAALKCSGGNPSNGSEPGHHGYRLFSVPEIEHLVDGGEIQDPCTLVSYYRYRQNAEK